MVERLSQPPPLSPSTLNRDSPLTATAFTASRTVSMIGSARTDSPFPISSPLSLQSPSYRRSADSQNQEQARPRPRSQVRNRLQSLNLTLSPSRMFPSYRLSSSSSASALSPSVYSPQTSTFMPRPSTSARVLTPTAELLPSDSPTGSPSKDGGRYRASTPTTMNPTPRLSTVSGVVHQTPRPAQQYVPIRSVTAVPVPVMRIRSEGAVATLGSTLEASDEVDDSPGGRAGRDKF